MKIHVDENSFGVKFLKLFPENEMDIFNLGKLSTNFKELEIVFVEPTVVPEIYCMSVNQEEFLKYLIEK